MHGDQFKIILIFYKIIIQDDLNDEYVCAILNSDLINNFYQIKYKNSIKVIKEYIQNIPIPIFDKNIQNMIISNYLKNNHKENQDIINMEFKKYNT